MKKSTNPSDEKMLALKNSLEERFKKELLESNESQNLINNPETPTPSPQNIASTANQSAVADEIGQLLDLLNRRLFTDYEEQIKVLIGEGRVVQIAMNGSLSSYSPQATSNAIGILKKGELDYSKSDFTIVTEVKNLPSYFLQGGALIKKSVIATDDVAMEQRSWHQLPSLTTLAVIKSLEGIAGKIEGFQGKILL